MVPYGRIDAVDTLVIPTVTTANGTPEVDAFCWAVCARHGEPATRRINMAVKWMPPPPGVGQNLSTQVVKRLSTNPNLNLAERLGETVLIHTPGWPLCARCSRTRVRWMALTLAIFGASTISLLVVVVGRIVLGQQAWLMAPAMAWLALLLLSVLPFSRGSLVRLTGTRGTPDASAVLVDNPHPAFRAAVG